MKQIESSGKTIEEALEAGLRELGCTIGDVTWLPLQEGAKGLFGLFGSRPAKVRITVNADEEDEQSIGDDILSALNMDFSKPQEAKPKESKPAPKEKIKFETKPMVKAVKSQPPEAKSEPKPVRAPAPEPAQAAVAPAEMPRAEASVQPDLPTTPP
ncbi:MAG TPA: Jag N-terminal domain-containing protein, partial [Clostridia bacterium]|nr:Jag N-terminal domain-containing protein [Clostridia bacterium]